MASLLGYLGALSRPRAALWCYLLWYLVVVYRYFDPSPRLWLTSLGLSAIIGVALLLNAGVGSKGGATLDGWQRFRFFLAPFCVSSFAAMVKGKGFLLVFSPVPGDLALGCGACAGFLVLVALAKRTARDLARRRGRHEDVAVTALLARPRRRA